MKVEVASGLVPFLGGGGSKCIPPQKILKFQSPKNVIFSILGTKFEDKRVYFFIQENVAFNLSVTQSIPNSNKQMMKTRLCTFARIPFGKQIIITFSFRFYDIFFVYI